MISAPIVARPERLVEIKGRYGPAHRFRFKQTIPLSL
jgi:hypothetical protein